MRTTVTIDDSLYRRVTARAAQTGRTVSDVVGDALREALRPRVSETPPQQLQVFGGSGVLPGVDLSSNAALRELMDEGSGVDAMR
ncbi:MAG: ribbon-helix-helix domain-containing protein [Thermoleophilia bacterium]|nr:ribbon-helix-helix domain-containing protein [Thermoleophilia bacterium]